VAVTSSTSATTAVATTEKTVFSQQQQQQQQPTTTTTNDVSSNLRKSQPSRIGTQCENYFVDDRQQVQININSYKMVFAKGQLHLYKKSSLQKARQNHQSITKVKHKKFTTFLQAWVEDNVSEVQKTQCTDWLLGRNTNDLVSNITIIKQETNLSKTPYFVYNRYKVEKLDS